eukprot:4445477-Amphidinium_carterae.1
MGYICTPSDESIPVNSILSVSVHVLRDSMTDTLKAWLQTAGGSSRWLSSVLSNIAERVFHDGPRDIWLTLYMFEIPRGSVNHATSLWWTVPWIADVLYGPASSAKHFLRDRLVSWTSKVGWLLCSDASELVLRQQTAASDSGVALIEQTCVSTLYLFLLLVSFARRNNRDDKVLMREADPLYLVLLRALCSRFLAKNITFTVLGVDVCITDSYLQLAPMLSATALPASVAEIFPEGCPVQMLAADVMCKLLGLSPPQSHATNLKKFINALALRLGELLAAGAEIDKHSVTWCEKGLQQLPIRRTLTGRAKNITTSRKIAVVESASSSTKKTTPGQAMELAGIFAGDAEERVLHPRSADKWSQ